ncbi:MAG: efflux RND transporter periplasmic adaptor subunit, partial [Candidatus Eisenbacteria bacterium]
MKKLFRSKWLWIGLGVLMLAVAVVATLQGRKGKTQSVTLTQARVKDVIQKVKAPGGIEARTTVKISADIPGRVVRLAVQEGDLVRRGQLLLEIDNTQYLSSVRQTQASTTSARARLERTRQALTLAEQAYQRRKALFERKLLSRNEMDQAENALLDARTEAAAAREEKARLDAALTAARDNLSKTTYRSPIEGRIVGLNIEEGEIVVVGTMNNPGTQILSVADLSRMMVKADVDETDVVDVRVGQKVKITVDALPDTSFDGTVTEVGNSATRAASGSATGETNFDVEVLFEQTVPEVRPGMTADVEVEVKRADQALAVPIQAVVIRQPEDLEERAKKGRKPKAPRAPKEGGANAAAPGAAGDDEEIDPLERKKREITGVFVLAGEVAAFKRVRTGISSETDIQILP